MGLVRPTGDVLRYADQGTLFQRPLAYALWGFAALLVIVGLVRVLHNQIPFVFRVAELVAALLAAQVLVYRGIRLRSMPTSEFPVTPILAEVLRAIGGVFAVWLAIAGLVLGLYSLGGEPGISSTHPLVTMGPAAIIVGPFLGFLTLLVAHYLAEMSSAIVAIANNTSPSKRP